MQGSMGQALEMALAVVIPALGTVLSYLAVKAIRVLEARTSIDVPERSERLLLEWIDQGIARAEQAAKNFAKTHPSSKFAGSEKLDLAIRYVLGKIQDAGWVGVGRDRLEDFIEARLGSRR